MKRKPRKLPICAAAEDAPFTIEAAASFEFIEAKQGEAPARPTFVINAYNGGAMRPYGYRELVIDLSGLESNKTIPILLDHDSEKIVGQANNIEISEKSIKMTGVVTGDHTVAGEPAHKIITHARGGFSWAASVGIAPGKTEFIDANQVVTVNGRQFNGPILVVRSGRLGETSFVAIGADKSASARVAATANTKKESAMNEFEKWLKANEFENYEAMSAKAKAKIKATYDAEQAETETETPPPVAAAKKVKAAGRAKSIADTADETRAKNERADKITAHAREWMRDRPDQVDDIQAAAEDAIEGNENPDDFERTMLRAMRANPAIGAPRRGKDQAISPGLLEAALCVRAKLPNIAKHFKTETLEAAEKAFQNGIGIQRLLEIAACQNSHQDLRCDGNLKKVVEAAFLPRMAIQAGGFSTLDTGGILTNTANKFARENFVSVESEYNKIAAKRSVSDFKQITTYSLTGDLTYDEVGAGGEIKHGTLSNLSYTNQVKTYAKMLAITRNDLINDDLSVFDSIGKRLGRGGALAVNKAFFTAFNANSTFFTTARGNKLASGAASVLSFDSLIAAMNLFLKQTDPDGLPLGIMPMFLVVPPELWLIAKRLVESTTLGELQGLAGGVSTAKTFGTLNPLAGKFTVVMSPYLSAANITGSSTTAWYLIGNPNDLPVVELAFLNGQEFPTIESADVDFNMLGVQFRGYHDFGVSLQEYRGGVMSPGA